MTALKAKHPTTNEALYVCDGCDGLFLLNPVLSGYASQHSVGWHHEYCGMRRPLAADRQLRLFGHALNVRPA